MKRTNLKKEQEIDAISQERNKTISIMKNMQTEQDNYLKNYNKRI